MSSDESASEDRRCTNCGKSVEDEAYEFWLFSTCRSCAAEPAPDRWGDGRIAPGTYRKWRYFPRWHIAQSSNLRTDGVLADA